MKDFFASLSVCVGASAMVTILYVLTGADAVICEVVTNQQYLGEGNGLLIVVLLLLCGVRVMWRYVVSWIPVLIIMEWHAEWH